MLFSVADAQAALSDVTAFSNFTILLLALVATLLAYLAYVFLYTPKNAPPSVPLLLPILQGKFDFKNEGPLPVVRYGYQTVGDCFRLKLAHKGVTVLIGPEANKVFFEAKDHQLSQKEVYSFTTPVFGRNIVYDCAPKIFIQQLKFLNKGLNGISMAEHCGKIVREATEYFAQWGQEGEVDLMNALSELTILTASRCLLGHEIRERVHTKFAQYYQELSDGMTHFSVFFPNAPTKAHRIRNAARAKIANLFSDVIRERRADPNASTKNDDFLQVLIDATYTDGRHLTDDEITGMLIVALFGGQHTSNITSTWMGLLIHRKKEQLLPRIYKEQVDVLSKHDGKITIDSLGEMDLLHRCMKETLRMYPPLILLMRYALEPMQYKNYVIPQGDIVVVAPPVTHRLPQVYTNPEDYDPDRFSPERAEDMKEKYSFISFGGGRHGCMGERFAYLQIKTIWSILFRTFDFEIIEDFPKCDYSAMVVGPKAPCMIRYKRKATPLI